MTDLEIIEHLRSSSDPDDQSIVQRYAILEWLRSKPEPSRTEQKWLGILERINREELDFLHAPTAYKIEHERPCFPKWHWPQELLILGQQRHEESQRTRND